MKKRIVFISSRLCVVVVSLIASYLVIEIGSYSLLSRIKLYYNLNWTLDATNYSTEYIFWEKSYCEINASCTLPEEKWTTKKILIDTNADSTPSECYRILFLGDSFTDAPWAQDNQSFAHVFAQHYADNSKGCVYEMRVSSGGSGTDQQYRKLLEVEHKLHPDIVLWQFYQNDLGDNIRYELYRIHNGFLQNRITLVNTTFIFGFLNQHVPFLRNTHFGKLLMSLATEKDVFRYNSTNLTNEEEVISYNEEKIPIFLKSIEKEAQKSGYKLYTVLAPLECQYVHNSTCDPDGNFQNSLKQILQQNTQLIDINRQIDVLGSSTETATLSAALFNTSDDKGQVGERHLSVIGNKYFGDELWKEFSQNRL